MRPDSSLKEVKLISIWTLTSPQPLTSSLKSSAVKSSRAFLGRTSSKPFLIAFGVKKNKKYKTHSDEPYNIQPQNQYINFLSNGKVPWRLTWRGCSATTSILCSAYFLTYSYTLCGVTGMLTPPDRSSTCTIKILKLITSDMFNKMTDQVRNQI